MPAFLTARVILLISILVVSLAMLFSDTRFSARTLLDSILVQLEPDLSLSAHYDWPANLQFDAPLEIPHINNYPAFTRVGFHGSVHWDNDVLTVNLNEVSHAAENNEWFDCKALREVRAGITDLGFFGPDYFLDRPQGIWSEWQPVVASRIGKGAYRAQGSWVYTIRAPLSGKPWEKRLAFQTRCTTKDGTTTDLMSFSSSRFLANAAHQQAYAPDPCNQPMTLRNALSRRCLDAVTARLDTPWGRLEVSQPPAKDITWLDIALVEKMQLALRPLVLAGVDVNKTPNDYSGDSALIYAAGNGDTLAVRELLKLGANKNQKNNVGYSAYNAAANTGHGDLAMELAEQGVQRDTNTGPAYSALSLAANRGEIHTVRRLLESGSDPDTQVGGWMTALHHAVKSNNLELTRTMLVGGANPNVMVTARRGETPLMMAAENGNIEMIKLLLMMGATLNTIDLMGKNATDYAEFFGKADASDYLCQLGLEPTAIDPSPKNHEVSKRANCTEPSAARPKG